MSNSNLDANKHFPQVSITSRVILRISAMRVTYAEPETMTRGIKGLRLRNQAGRRSLCERRSVFGRAMPAGNKNGTPCSAQRCRALVIDRAPFHIQICSCLRDRRSWGGIQGCALRRGLHWTRWREFIRDLVVPACLIYARQLHRRGFHTSPFPSCILTQKRRTSAATV